MHSDLKYEFSAAVTHSYKLTFGYLLPSSFLWNEDKGVDELEIDLSWEVDTYCMPLRVDVAFDYNVSVGMLLRVTSNTRIGEFVSTHALDLSIHPPIHLSVYHVSITRT